MIMVLMVVIVMMARPLSQNAKRSKLEHLKAADDECEGFWLASSHDLASLHCEVVLLLPRLPLHRLHRLEAREASVGEEDEVSLPPCLYVLTPLVQPTLFHNLDSEYFWSNSKYQTRSKATSLCRFFLSISCALVLPLLYCRKWPNYNQHQT